MMPLAQRFFTHPLLLLPGLALAALALLLGLWGQSFPGFGVKVVGQRPLLQGLGLALLLAGVGLGLAEPRWGVPEVPRLTVYVLLDASRSMLVADAGGGSRWKAALEVLDRLWAQPNPGVRFSLDLLTGDTLPLMPPGEDRQLLQDSLRAIQPGEVGSPGTSMGRGLAQLAAQAEAKTPAIVFLIGDGEETWEAPAEALQRANSFLGKAKLPLYTYALGQRQRQPVPAAAASDRQGKAEALFSQAHPEFLRQLAEANGGRCLAPGEDPTAPGPPAPGPLPAPGPPRVGCLAGPGWPWPVAGRRRQADARLAPVPERAAGTGTGHSPPRPSRAAPEHPGLEGPIRPGRRRPGHGPQLEAPRRPATVPPAGGPDRT